MIKGIKNNYRILNTIMFGFCIFIFAFPLISNIMKCISPVLTLCPFLLMTGKPCPLCGGTRFIKGLPNAIINNNIKYFFDFFGIFIIVILIEFIFRTINLLKKNHSNKLIYTDIAIHLILLLSLIIYEVNYMINLYK